ncbi:hypothetical protein P691DRAFT_26846 [Macrolepiota fuliginosa MF-IS2]|uniref:Uncharacterized protein n=1 Tax=Macrolepiota fuliginosa MF-IS2 TaxID=1400762 RepID=A0A9P5XCE0_9AGAR|nr:hypothetical protein P691DRAFT_26846 [Macrolepiota fuliginosa MF-IS2]
MPFFKGAHNFIVSGDDSKDKHQTKEEEAAHVSQAVSHAMGIVNSIASNRSLTSGMHFNSQAVSPTASGTIPFASPMSSDEMRDMNAELANMEQQLREKDERKAKKAEERARNGGRRRGNGNRQRGNGNRQRGNGGRRNGLPGNGAQPSTGMLSPPTGMNPFSSMNVTGAPMNGIQPSPEMLAIFAAHRAGGLPPPPPPEVLSAMFASGSFPPPPMTPDGLPRLPQLPIDPHTGQLLFALPQPASGSPQFPPPVSSPTQNHPTGRAPDPNQLPTNVVLGQQPDSANANLADSSGRDAAPDTASVPPHDEVQ